MPHSKVLLFIDYYLPGYKAGGPVRTIANIVSTLKKEVGFYIVTRDHDLGDKVPYQNIRPNMWVHFDDYAVMYLDSQHTSYSFLKFLMQQRNYDIIYFNSLFSAKFTLLPLLVAKSLKPRPRLMLAPRGMLGSGALKIKSHKKKLFLNVAKASGLFKNVVWHASTLFEEKEIRQNFGEKVQVKIAIDLASVPANNPPVKEKETGKASFYFISRISPKKNLLGGLKALAQAQDYHAIEFNIIGPVEDVAYWEECQRFINNEIPAGIKVNFLGPVPYPQVPEAISKFHFFLFPTFSENYGHVIIEALSCGCPVIISDQTPWRNLEVHRMGWDIGINDQKKLLEIIDQCVQMGQETYTNMSINAVEFLRKQVLTEEVIDQNRRLFII